MASPATVDDIESRWRPLTESELTVATTRLEDAWRKLKKDLPTLDGRLASDEDLFADTVRVLADSVIRVLRSLERNGLRRGTVAVDDGTTTWEAEDARTDLYFTDQEYADLSETGTRKRARFFSVQPT